jgi:hypothetical protein
MGGALLELVALGKQDTHLVGNPQISFFKNVYKRHTNFSIKSIKNEFMDQGGFGLKNSCVIERKGDLLKNIYLEIELPVLSTGSNISWINGIGNHIIDRVELLMGGEIIDTLYGEFLDIYSSLTTSQSKQDGYYKMVGKNSSYTNETQKNSLSLMVPLPFWFTKNIGYALPLVALQYTDIKLDIFLKHFSECWYSGNDVTGSPTPSTVKISEIDLYCDFIYLDTFERTKYAKKDNIEYLIEQIQINDKNIISSNQESFNCELYFNHPIKELIWIYKSNEMKTYNIWGKYGNNPNSSNTAPLSYVELRLNNNDRFETRKAEYFRLMQPYQNHTSIPTTNYIYSYSFGLYPEKFQPSGTCNFSKIDNSNLILTMASSINAGEISVYAINYNILKIKNGMAGLLYST